MSITNPLGEKTQYINHYDASLLFPIKRTESRDKLSLGESLPFRGEDRWTAYEVSWLDALGKPQIRVAEFTLPYDSPNIIESKSFKLYLNSFNQTRFDSERKVQSLLAVDLSQVAGAPVSVNLMPLNHAKALLIGELIGTGIDELEVSADVYQPQPELLVVDASRRVNEVVYSHLHLLKTNCPVTDQPDWATVFVEYAGGAIDHGALLQYIISFRNHQDFHENSVERLFCDINDYCQPDRLAVYMLVTLAEGG